MFFCKPPTLLWLPPSLGQGPSSLCHHFLPYTTGQWEGLPTCQAISHLWAFALGPLSFSPHFVCPLILSTTPPGGQYPFSDLPQSPSCILSQQSSYGFNIIITCLPLTQDQGLWLIRLSVPSAQHGAWPGRQTVDVCRMNEGTDILIWGS